MRTLDKRASEILRALLALQTSKIDNTDEAYMPVYIEIIDARKPATTFRWHITGSRTGT